MTRRTLALTLTLLFSATASADDLADEADLHFRLGAEAYQARNYSVALEHFLASNRLVPNSNVAYNVASTFEQLGQLPEAYRYYSQVLLEEQSEKQRQVIQAALARIGTQVAVLEVTTTPPGATLYVDRKDLGPRGASPRLLAMQPGTYRVLAELSGYRSAESEPVVAAKGSSRAVHLTLDRIVGTIHVAETTPGLEVEIPDSSPKMSCSAPCDLQAPPGRQLLVATAPGFGRTETSAEVRENEISNLDLKLEPLRGTLVVSAEPKGAEVVVDGHVEGFAPTVLNLPIGERKVELLLVGFHTVTRDVTVKADEQANLSVVLPVIQQVSAASRTAETLDQAPSSVSIVTGEEIQAMGYPTIAEAVRGVRGVFINDDSSYTSVGIRGFGPAGSYGNRVLVMQDGHITNDNWINSSYVGFDARSDLSDVKRIEVIRGPDSVLYGTGAITGIINLVTDDRDSPSALDATLGTYDNGTYVMHATGREKYSDNVGASATAGYVTSTGRDFYFPEYAATGVDGNSRGADGFTTQDVRGKAWAGPLTLSLFYNVRDKSLPSGEYDTNLGDPRTQLIDGRSFAELRFEPHLSDTVQLLTRIYWDRYTYNSYLYGTDANGGLRQETYLGLWGGAEARVAWTPLKEMRWMAGVDGQYHGTTLETGVANVGEATEAAYLHRNDPYKVGAAYLTGDWSPFSFLSLNAGARLDAYSTFGTSVNPRGAVIIHPYLAGTLKLMAGRAFRAPSIYELYYNDGGLTQIPGCTTNPCTMRPEGSTTGEVEFTHHLDDAWSLLGTVYGNYITDLLALRSLPNDPDVAQYANTPVPVETLGAEAEVRREWREGWMASASYAFQHSEYVEPAGTPAAQQLRQVPNSPNHLGSLRFGCPIVGHYLKAFTRLTAESSRYDVSDSPGDPPQLHTPPSLVWDLVLSGELPEYHLRYSAGAYNLADERYSVPVSTEFSPIDTVQEPGRTLMAKVSVNL